MINLNKEVKKNEETLKRVRLGASLFQILRNDEEKKKEELLEAKRDQMGSGMRIRPMIESEDEMDEGSLSEDEELNKQELNLVNNEVNEIMKREDEMATGANNGAKTTRTVRISDEDVDKEHMDGDSPVMEGRPHTFPVHKFKRYLFIGHEIRLPRFITILIKIIIRTLSTKDLTPFDY